MKITRETLKDLKEITLYNFATIRDPEYLSKEALESKLNFICYIEEDFIPNEEKESFLPSSDFSSKSFLNFEQINTKPKFQIQKDDQYWKVYDENCDNIQIILNNFFDRILFLYKSGSDDFYEIHKLLNLVDHKNKIKIDLFKDELDAVKKAELAKDELKRTELKIWLAFIFNLKSGGDFKQKEIATNLLRFFHLKKYQYLFDDESKSEKVENFEVLINARIVIPEELFPKSETFFYGERYKLNSPIIQLLRNEHRLKVLYLSKEILNDEDDDAMATILDSQINELEGEIKLQKEKQKRNPIYNLNDFNTPTFLLTIEFIGGKTYALISAISIESKIENAMLTIKGIEHTFKKENIVNNNLFSDFDAHFLLLDKNANTINKPINNEEKTHVYELKITFASEEEETIDNTLTWRGKNELSYESIGHFSQSDYYGKAFKPSGYGIRMLGIADYRKVVSTISRYVPAEVAHIENIMASEFREKVSTKEYSTEITEFESTESESEKLNETTTNDRFQMQNEVAQILNDQKTTNVNASANFYGTGYSTTLNAGQTSTTSKQDSNKQAVTNAKEVTNKAVEKIVSKVKKERTVKVTEKFVDVNKYGFDNRGNKDHVSGVYRHINAVYRNRIHNYGKRMTMEFSIPEPALIFMLSRVLDNKLQEEISKIPKPKDLIESLDLITLNNYLEYIDNYGIKETEYIKYPNDIIERKKISSSGNAKLSLQKDNFEITSISYSGSLVYKTSIGTNGQDAMILNVGSTFKIFANVDQVYINSNHPPRIDGGPDHTVTDFNPEIFIENNIIPFKDEYKDGIDIEVQSDVISFNVIVVVNFKATANEIKKWQIQTYDLLKQTYQTKISKYKTSVQDVIDKYFNEEKAKNQDLSKNLQQSQNRKIEIETLKRNCLSYLINEDHKDNHLRKFGSNNFEFIEQPNIFEEIRVKRDHKLDEYTAFVRFLEQAFEWDNMSYSFYPYYWGDRDTWKEKYNEDSDDPLHKAFLQAGMARVMVTVRPKFEDAVNMYLVTGKIWMGGSMPVYGSSMFLSIADELNGNSTYVVDEEWESVLPTNLIALQSSGVAINQRGLPDLEYQDNLGVVADNPAKLPRPFWKRLLGLFS